MCSITPEVSQRLLTPIGGSHLPCARTYDYVPKLITSSSLRVLPTRIVGLRRLPSARTRISFPLLLRWPLWSVTSVLEWLGYQRATRLVEQAEVRVRTSI